MPAKREFEHKITDYRGATGLGYINGKCSRTDPEKEGLFTGSKINSIVILKSGQQDVQRGNSRCAAKEQKIPRRERGAIFPRGR